MSISDVIDQLLGNGASAAPGAPLVITPPVAQTDPTPLVAGDPMVITPQAAPAATPRAAKASDWTLPAVTMTPPPVSAVPFGPSSGMIAPQPMPSTMGDVLGAQPRSQRRQYPILAMPTIPGPSSGGY